MPIWEIVGLVILGITLFIIACYIGVVGFFFEVLFSVLGAIFGGGSSSSGGSGFGGGDSGGGGSSDDW
jgi:uncharacterized membrane protein YgcG